VEILDF